MQLNIGSDIFSGYESIQQLSRFIVLEYIILCSTCTYIVTERIAICKHMAICFFNQVVLFNWTGDIDVLLIQYLRQQKMLFSLYRFRSGVLSSCLLAHIFFFATICWRNCEDNLSYVTLWLSIVQDTSYLYRVYFQVCAQVHSCKQCHLELLKVETLRTAYALF